MEEVKRKRGRPKKNKLPEEIQTLVQEVEEKRKEEAKKEEESLEIKVDDSFKWDVPIGTPIEFFDANLSYELTGYRPINKYQSLDFNPKWFTEVRDTFNRTGHYTEYKFGTKSYTDFWKEQYKRCKYGMTVNGYTVTGDHYFFLNFFRLEDLNSTSEAGIGRSIIFPNFMEGQYEWFHYLQLAKRLRLNACMMKAREAESYLLFIVI